MSVKKLEHCLFLILILTSWMIQRTISDCPDQCVCMWKSGKETTECINRDKKAIPPGIAPSTQVLDLRGNNIRVLHNNVFLQLGITNLQRIYCPYCGIVEIEARAFYRLTNLVELDLSENAMREVPSEAWKHTKALMRLNLSGNPIKLIRSGAFTDLEFVTSIALSHCDIETLEDGAFEGMDALTEVKLESNKLLYLQGSGLFPRNLNHIEIHDNPFRCDCRLLDFTHWLQRSGVPRPVEPACKTPARLENRTLAGLHLEELACLPQVEPAALVTDAVAGANVSLRCSVFGLPSASVSWWHSNRLVANGSELQHAWEDQYYSIAEYRSNDHQLVSELVVLSIRPEDDGTFFCAAQNPAGVARANFTVRLVDNILDSISSGSETAVSTSSGTSGTSGLQENTDQLNLESAEIPDEDMFKVEYILGFGAAAVIVLTIIIVLILYLILQCRSQRRKRRAARAAGLHCDSNSGSYMERSTVDFIVPGEMELTSAVRSVSASAKCNGVAAKTLIQPPKDKDGCGSGNDGDDEEEYGLTSKKNSHVMYKNSWNCSNGVGGGAGGSFLPPYRHPPPYACPRSSHQQQPNNPIMCQCCGQFQPQQQPHSLPPAQAWYQPQFQHPPPPHHLMMSTIPPNMAPLCPRAPNAQLGIPLRPPRPQNMLMAAQAPVPNTASSNAYVTSHHPYFRQQQQQPPTQLHQPFFHPSGPNTNGFYHPNHHPNQFKQWILQDTSESSTACDNEEVKYGPFSDGEAEKCHYRHSSNRPTRSRSLPRRPNSSMMTYSPNVLATANVANVVPHYVTLSRSALVESADARFVEQQSLHISNQRHLPPPIAKRYSSQPHLNRNVLDYDTCNKPPIIKPKPNHVSVLPQQQPQQPQASKPPKPKYQQPVSQQELENSEYLFPDLPPPPDALLDNTTSETSIQQNSRCSSLDDLNWVTSAAEMSRVHKSPAPANTVNVIGFHQNTKKNNNTDHQRSNTLPNQAKEPISIMKKRASNPVELRRSSGAIRVDLSGADKTIRRPGSEPDLKISPMRSAMTKEKRHSGMSQTSGKKVMFSGINSDEENQENEDNPIEDNVWVLRQEDVQMEPLKIEDDIPVTGVIIAQPQPCKFAASNMQHLQTHPLVHNAHSPQKMMMQQPQGANGHAPQPPKLPKPTPPPPPPRTTPVSTGATVNQQAVAAAAGGGAAALNAQPRPANPVLQRPMQHQQFHESPDEGYHEDDAGSEVL